MYRSLRDFIDALECAGELARVKCPVSPEFEMAEIADRMAKSPGGGKALLFEDSGTGIPVLMNMFGSERRMALALGVSSLDELPRRITGFAESVMSPKGSIGEKLAVLPWLGRAARWFPRRTGGRGECQQIVAAGAAVRMSSLPVLKCWPADGGRFVTLPMVHTADPVTGARNVGMYRMQVFDDRTTGMHWHIHKTGARHYEAWRRAGRRMPVSVALGGDPAYTYAATAPLPDGIDEYLLAGFLRGRPVKLVKCLTNDLYVPSDCDFVIEGYVDPAEEKAVEGPFGDHTGFYSLEDLYPAFHVTAVTRRRDAVWPATVVGIPPQEDVFISAATERIFLAPIRMALQPEVEDLRMPAAGVSHNLAVVAMAPRFPGHVRAMTSSLWGAGQMMFDKYMIAVPAGTDVRDDGVLAGLIRGMDPAEDVIRGEGVLDVLDHAAAVNGVGGKMALDLTRRDALTPRMELPAAMLPAGGVGAWCCDWLAEWGVLVLYADPRDEADAAAFADANPCGAKVVAMLDLAARGLSGEETLWIAAGNTDPGRDVRVSGGRIFIDARTKIAGSAGMPSRFPNVVVSSAETVAAVDGRWKEYGLGEFLPSPSARYRRLSYGAGAEIDILCDGEK